MKLVDFSHRKIKLTMFADLKKKFREAVLSALPGTLEAAWKAVAGKSCQFKHLGRTAELSKGEMINDQETSV